MAGHNNFVILVDLFLRIQRTGDLVADGVPIKPQLSGIPHNENNTVGSLTSLSEYHGVPI